MEQQNEQIVWGYMSKEEFETKEYISGQLKWLENKVSRSEYEEALYKKLKAEQDGKS